MNVGQYIKQLRTARGLSQEELGKLIGVQRAAVQKWECGKVQNLKRETIKKLSEIFNVSPSSFVDGFESADGKQRAKGVKIPVLGYVRAGLPVEAIEEVLDYEEITEDMSRTGTFFALKISGDSMEPRFCDGDVVIVRQQETVENGEIAVVLINGDDATVKKFYRTDAGIQLVATNPSYAPLFYAPKEVNALPVRVLGKVVELRAKF